MHKGLGVVFPGQGSQEPGMGRDLAEHWPEAMYLWKKAERTSGLPLREIYWSSDETAQSVTRNLQPALMVVNMSLWLFLAQRLKPAAVSGHSLGEYAALFAAQVLPLEEILELASLRGKLMDEARNQDGCMAAILKLNQTQVEALVANAIQTSGQELRIANFNTPAQFVISGHAQAVEHVRTQVKSLKGRAVLLPVSNAFHSPYMNEAGAELAEYMERLDWRDPRIPIYFNVTAKPEPNGLAVKKIMQQQMTSSVYWTQSIENQYADGLHTFVELGPKGALVRMISQILNGQPDVTIANVSNLTDLPALEEILP